MAVRVSGTRTKCAKNDAATGKILKRSPYTGESELLELASNRAGYDEMEHTIPSTNNKVFIPMDYCTRLPVAVGVDAW